MNALYLHVGIDKTGSTAIQQFLDRHQQALRESGLNYVQASRGGHYHHSRLWDESLAGELTAWEAVRDEVAASDIEKHVISHEGLYTLDAPTWKKIARILDGIDVRVVVYVRRQSDYVCSGLVQRAKQGQGKLLGEYSERELVNLGKDYEKILESLLNLVDEDRMAVRCYESSSLEYGSALEDFLAQLNVALPAGMLMSSGSRQDANPTPPVEVVLGLDRLRSMHLPENLRRYLVSVAMTRFPGDGSTFISDKTLEKIDRKQARTNRRVAQRWFGRRELFVDDRKFSYRAVQPELDKRFWTCVWMQLAGHGLPSWSGEAARLADLLRSGRAISLARDEYTLSCLLRLPADDGEMPVRLMLGLDDAVKDAIELSINGKIVHEGTPQRLLEVELERQVHIAQRNLVEITLRSRSGNAARQWTMKLELKATIQNAEPSRAAS